MDTTIKYFKKVNASLFHEESIITLMNKINTANANESILEMHESIESVDQFVKPYFDIDDDTTLGVDYDDAIAIKNAVQEYLEPHLELLKEYFGSDSKFAIAQSCRKGRTSAHIIIFNKRTTVGELNYLVKVSPDASKFEALEFDQGIYQNHKKMRIAGCNGTDLKTNKMKPKMQAITFKGDLQHHFITNPDSTLPIWKAPRPAPPPISSIGWVDCGAGRAPKAPVDMEIEAAPISVLTPQQLTEATEILELLPIEASDDHGTWLEIMFVGKKYGLLEEVKKFSQKSTKFAEKDFNIRWDSIPVANKFTIRTLYHYAQKYKCTLSSSESTRMELMEIAMTSGTTTRIAEFAETFFQGTLKFANNWYHYDDSTGLWIQDDGIFIKRALSTEVASFVDKKKMEHINAITDPKQRMTAAGPYDFLLKKLLDNAPKDSIVADLKTIVYDAEFPATLDKITGMLPVANGLIDLKTKTIRPYTIDDRCTRKEKIHYNPEAGYAKIMQFMIEIQNSEEAAQFLMDVVGYIFTGEKTEDIFVCLEGRGGNGKTIFKELVCKTLHGLTEACNSKHLSRSATADNLQKFYKGLVGKRFAHISEISAGFKVDESILKTWSSKDDVSVREHYKMAYTTSQQTTPVILLNDAMDMPCSQAMLRRALILQFPVLFTDDEEKIALNSSLYKKRNPTIMQEIPLEQVLNMIVEGAFRYYQRDYKLPRPAAVIKHSELMLQKGDRETDAVCKVAVYTGLETDTVLRKDMTEAVKAHLDDDKVSTQKVSKAILNKFGVEPEKITPSGKPQGYYYTGFKLKDTAASSNQQIE